MCYWRFIEQQIKRIQSLFSFSLSLFFLIYCGSTTTSAQVNNESKLDVISYHVNITPDIASQRIAGTVIIEFLSGTNKAIFDIGHLYIIEVKGLFLENYTQEDRKLIVHFDKQANKKKEIKISYSGSAGMGLKFFPKVKQVHSAYATQQWMVCNNDPDDRATIKTDLIVPNNLTGIANGTLATSQEISSSETLYSWDQKVAAPAYTYGFAIGRFNQVQESYDGMSLNYYANNYSEIQLKKVFATTKDMLTFFEKISGVPYFQTSYSQLLDVGKTSQEMVGLAILRNGYGQQVLNDSSQLNLSAHELAHQWWGNMITCESWNHFWLNEAMAVYMSSAYKEHRFGKKYYEEDIAVYLGAYQKVKDKNMDKPLVFDNWDNPTSEDRTIVYYKGAYVLHLLRLELGDETFWKGIKHYSQQHYGKSVTTPGFQLAMENCSKRNLQPFFDRWVY